MGGDFQDKNAHEKFKNLDKLIHYVNLEQENSSNINVFSSTPSCYLYALNKAKKEWTTKTDDFFPYAMIPASYWTDYYTSRPALKLYERYTNNILQVTRQLNGFSPRGKKRHSGMRTPLVIHSYSGVLESRLFPLGLRT
jgi:lysosomal alpha-mannosidase